MSYFWRISWQNQTRLWWSPLRNYLNFSGFPAFECQMFLRDSNHCCNGYTKLIRSTSKRQFLFIRYRRFSSIFIITSSIGTTWSDLVKNSASGEEVVRPNLDISISCQVAQFHIFHATSISKHALNLQFNHIQRTILLLKLDIQLCISFDLPFWKLAKMIYSFLQHHKAMPWRLFCDFWNVYDALSWLMEHAVYIRTSPDRLLSLDYAIVRSAYCILGYEMANSVHVICSPAVIPMTNCSRPGFELRVSTRLTWRANDRATENLGITTRGIWRIWYTMNYRAGKM